MRGTLVIAGECAWSFLGAGAGNGARLETDVSALGAAMNRKVFPFQLVVVKTSVKRCFGLRLEGGVVLRLFVSMIQKYHFPEFRRWLVSDRAGGKLLPIQKNLESDIL